jgi:hypothetical protein
MTPELFRRLLPCLVAQLRVGPPAEAQTSISAHAVPGEAEIAGSDVYGEMAVATLIELAASAGNDELWKPFNHQVLLSPSLPVGRRAAITLKCKVSASAALTNLLPNGTHCSSACCMRIATYSGVLDVWWSVK